MDNFGDFNATKTSASTESTGDSWGSLSWNTISVGNLGIADTFKDISNNLATTVEAVNEVAQSATNAVIDKEAVKPSHRESDNIESKNKDIAHESSGDNETVKVLMEQLKARDHTISELKEKLRNKDDVISKQKEDIQEVKCVMRKAEDQEKDISSKFEEYKAKINAKIRDEMVELDVYEELKSAHEDLLSLSNQSKEKNLNLTEEIERLKSTTAMAQAELSKVQSDLTLQLKQNLPVENNVKEEENEKLQLELKLQQMQQSHKQLEHQLQEKQKEHETALNRVNNALKKAKGKTENICKKNELLTGQLKEAEG